MSEEAKKAVRQVCEKIFNGSVFQQAVELAIDLHDAAKADEASGKEVTVNAKTQ